MNKIAIVFFAIVALNSCSQKSESDKTDKNDKAIDARKQTCMDLRNGTFKYCNPESGRFIITRKGKLQIERDTVSGFEVRGSVKWKSYCEYELTFIGSSNPKDKKNIGKKLNSEIIDVDGDTLTIKSVLEGKELEFKMIKIKE
ncbi:hypothetical protein [Flavobacterium sp.]|uniref:hypothetical protein n=1 Tax=Flavobacterium sp. TaxID=239 RepID=UPI003D6BDA6E